MDKFKNSIFIFFAKFIIFIFINFLKFTCKISFRGKLPKEPCVVVWWHSRLAMMILAYKHYYLKQNDKKLAKVIISSHKDGVIISKVISFFGVGTITGSSSKGKISALKEAFNLLDMGYDVGITPDGPRGPVNSISDGAILIAKKKNVKIYGLNYEASKFWQLNSWDKMIIPKPFSKINFSLSGPLDVKDLNLDDAKKCIQNMLFDAAKIDSKF